MFETTPFYNESIRKTVVAFGSLFNSVYVNVGNDIVRVPLSYAPKQKWFDRINNGKLEDGRTFAMTLPRMGFEITSYSYDPDRKRNTITKVIKTPNGFNNTKKQQTFRWAEVPYKLEFGLYIMAKNMDTGLRIVESILPYFTPDFNVTINFTEIDKQIDVPVVLNSIDSEDIYEGDFDDRRTIMFTLSFTVKTNIYGPLRDSKAIKQVQVGIHDTSKRGVTGTATPYIPIDYSRVDAYAVRQGVTGPTGPSGWPADTHLATGPEVYDVYENVDIFKDVDSTWY